MNILVFSVLSCCAWVCGAFTNDLLTNGLRLRVEQPAVNVILYEAVSAWLVPAVMAAVSAGFAGCSVEFSSAVLVFWFFGGLLFSLRFPDGFCVS